VETDDPREVTAFLTPYLDLMAFDEHVVTAIDYDTAIENIRKSQQAAPAPV
jgi:hypothetical protein